jgi:hypothetical protein
MHRSPGDLEMRGAERLKEREPVDPPFDLLGIRRHGWRRSPGHDDG